MTAPYRLSVALAQRTEASVALAQRTEASAGAIDAAQTPRAQLDAHVDYLRALVKLAEHVDPEATGTITKRVVVGVCTGITEMRQLIEEAIGDLKGPGARQGRAPEGLTPERRRPGAEPPSRAAGPADQTKNRTVPKGGPVLVPVP